MDPWTQILASLETRIGAQSFATWLKPTTFSHQENGTVFVRVPSHTCRDWITEHYLADIRSAANSLVPPVHDVLFVSEAAELGPPVAPPPPPVRIERQIGRAHV